MDVGDSDSDEVCVHHEASKEVCHFIVRHGSFSFEHDIQLRICSLNIIESGLKSKEKVPTAIWIRYQIVPLMTFEYASTCTHATRPGMNFRADFLRTKKGVIRTHNENGVFGNISNEICP